MQRTSTTFLGMLCLLALVSNDRLNGQTKTVSSPNLPPAGTYVSPTLYHQLYANGIIVKDISHDRFTNNSPPPPLGATQPHSFGSIVQMMVSTDNGTTFTPQTANANCNVSVHHTSDAGGTQFYQTEMLALDISGGSLPAGVLIRESPTLASTGQTTIRPTTGGNYKIDSFFDIFTEMTTDGGATWSPANTKGHMALKPDPPTPVVTHTPNLPPIPGHYVTPAQYHQAYANGIIIKDISHEGFTRNDPPPAPGGSSTHSFGSTVQMDVSTDGGNTYSPQTMSGNVSVSVASAQDSPGVRYFNTEMLSMSLTGAPGVMVRESPTRQSTGKTAIMNDGPTQSRIGSFFDIFTELSLDGGNTWSPADVPAHVVAETPRSILVAVPTENFPPTAGHYINPFGYEPSWPGTSVVMKGATDGSFSLSGPPPPAGQSQLYDFNSIASMQISTDGGTTFQPVTAPASMVVQAVHNRDKGEERFFDTEMLALSLSGGGLPNGVMIRESPTKQSLGQTTVRNGTGGGGPQMDSFFDIFTELSIDGGSTWFPASGPTHMELVADVGSICGMKWEDKNGDGIKDPGEPGLGGWMILAKDASGIVDTAITDASGNYCFTALALGTWHVQEVLQPGWTQTGGQPYYTLTVGANQTINGIDFGNFRIASIYGTKFNDLNGNGVKDPGEPGLPGWTICLQRAQPPPSSTFPTTGGTDFLGGTLASVNINLYPAYGGGNFTLCASGNTSVQRANPSGGTANDSMLTEITLLDMVGTLPPPFPNDTFHIRHKTDRRSFGQIQGNSFPAVSFFDVFYELEMPVSLGGGTYVNYTPTHLGASINTIPPGGQSYLGVGSAIVNKNNPTDTLGIIKFVDHCVTSNPQQCHDISCPKPAPNPVPPGAPFGTACVVTDANGNYCFMELPGGTYTVREAAQSGWTQTSADPAPVTIGSGESITGVNFGNKSNGCRICVTKWNDINHNQQPRDGDDVTMAGVTFYLALPGGVVDTAVTDAGGVACFDNVPLGISRLTEAVPPGFTVSVPKAGYMDLSCQGLPIEVDWLNTAALTDTLFRTASMADWAYTLSLDGKGKFKPIKCKPDKFDFKLNLRLPPPIAGSNIAPSVVDLKFNMPVDTLILWKGKGKVIPVDCAQLAIDPKGKRQLWRYDFNGCTYNIGDTIQFDGTGLKGKPIVVSYKWSVKGAAPQVVYKGTLPGTRVVMKGDTLKDGILRVPIPNLLNVYFDLQAQGAFPFTVGDAAGANSVLLDKPTTVEKSLVIISRAGVVMHTGRARCLDSLANGKLLSKQVKGLPPSKQNNVLFAEALALRLNILASQHLKFPAGLCELIYDDHKDTSQQRTNPNFDNKTVCQIMAQVDSFLACKSNPKNATAGDYLAVIRNINNAFRGPIDTIRWSCEKLRLKGVRPLKDVPYLRAIPGLIPPFIEPNGSAASRMEPAVYTLRQNYPNPFNPTTTIEFVLQDPAVVTLKVYNTLGQEVATLIDHESMVDGEQQVDFEAANLPSGVYFYRIMAQTVLDEDLGTLGKTFISVKKMILLK